MCDSCGFEDTIATIENHLVQSAYAPYAAELVILKHGILERRHIGDAIEYRLQDMEKKVKDEQLKI